MIDFYVTNLVNQSNFTASTNNLLFPVSNLKDHRRTKVFRSTTNTDSVILDFGETSEIDSVFLVDNQMSGFGISTFGFAFNGTSDFSSPAFSDTLTFSSEFGLGVKHITTQNYRFMKVSLTSSLGYCELSKFFVGKRLDLDGKSINFGWSFRDNDLSTTRKNRYGQRFTDRVARQRTFNIAFTNLNKDQLEEIMKINDQKSTNLPFYVSIGCADMTNELERFQGMVFLDSIPTVTNGTFGRYNLGMSLEEAM